MIYINTKKIHRIKEINSNCCVITDFDRTLTTKQSEPSMGIVPCYLGGECLKERTKIFEYYRPLELDYTLETKQKQLLMKEWASKSFTLLSNYITQDIINESLKNANIHLRHGVKEFLKKMNDRNVTVIIMSSGIGNIVEAFLKKENSLFNNITIVSNFFEFTNGKAYINIENIMATSNKEYKRIPEHIRKEIENKKCILFGDLIEDIKMANRENLSKTLTFGFLDDNLEKNLKEYNNNFDIVLTDNSDFNDVKNILN